MIFWNSFSLFFSCLCSVGKKKKTAQTSGWPGLIQKLVQTLIDSVLFFLFIKCLLSVMNVFISGPALTSAENNAQCVRLRWRQDPLFCFCFCFKDLKLRIKNKTHNIAINHDLWSWLFVGEVTLFFFQLKENGVMLFFLSYTSRQTVCKVFISLWVLLFCFVFIFF